MCIDRKKTTKFFQTFPLIAISFPFHLLVDLFVKYDCELDNLAAIFANHKFRIRLLWPAEPHRNNDMITYTENGRCYFYVQMNYCSLSKQNVQ